MGWTVGHIHLVDGFPRVDWDGVSTRVAPLPESEWGSAYTDAAREWLTTTRASLNGAYLLEESPNFLLLASCPQKACHNLLRFLEQIRERILTALLRDVAQVSGYGKHVAIVLEDMESYYSYISYFYPDAGDFAASSGVFLNGGDAEHGGYGHFVSFGRDVTNIERVVAHELTHNCLSHLPIPAWLNEGLAMTSERALVGNEPLLATRDVMEEHRSMWRDGVIQEFWSGGSLDEPDERSQLTYHLAEMTVRTLSRDYERFAAFVRRADFRDAGEAAALEVFGHSLGDVIAQFLGPGEWMPRPDDWRRES